MRRIANSACVERKRRVSEDMEVQSVGVMERISEELEYYGEGKETEGMWWMRAMKRMGEAEQFGFTNFTANIHISQGFGVL